MKVKYVTREDAEKLEFCSDGIEAVAGKCEKMSVNTLLRGLESNKGEYRIYAGYIYELLISKFGLLNNAIEEFELERWSPSALGDALAKEADNSAIVKWFRKNILEGE